MSVKPDPAWWSNLSDETVRLEQRWNDEAKKDGAPLASDYDRRQYRYEKSYRKSLLRRLYPPEDPMSQWGGAAQDGVFDPESGQRAGMEDWEQYPGHRDDNLM